MGRTGTTLRWTATAIVVAAALALGIFVMPPLFRGITLALLKASAIAVAAYVVFVALSMRGTR